MAKKGNTTGPMRWFRHRWLVEAEAILLVGVAQELIQRQISGVSLPHWGKTLWTMACILGIMGGLIVALRIVAHRAVNKAHQTVRAMPFPAPYFLLHLLALSGIFLLYAWVWNFWPVMDAQGNFR